MASITISREDKFPNGTSVAAYEVVGLGQTPTSGAPPGSAVDTDTVTGGSFTFTGLDDSTEYIAYASSPDRYLRFSTPPATTTGGGGGLLAVTEAGNKTGSYAPVIAAARELHTFTLTGNGTFAPTGWDEGAEILIEVTQNALGPWTFSVNDGSGARSVDISGTDLGAGTMLLRLLGRTVTDLDVEVPGAGATGPQGIPGAQGDPGVQGDPGAQGNPGAAGADGQTTVTVRSVSGNDTGVLADAGKKIRQTSGSAAVHTIPANASVAYPISTVIHHFRAGAGSLTLAAAGGVTINSRGGLLAVADQYTGVTAHKVGTNEWDLEGNLA